ncbi:hypothetical protein EVAR_48540_1 [Eumeta japonica]|uniref:Uncharacterized protein n=1 Tax=Eumeta variegata TaxID=151549 RepID=A0A4C1Y7Y4_EUMVA|nr:hypothetical protein EVAR_48540_1 [Eumeta japonica]
MDSRRVTRAPDSRVITSARLDNLNLRSTFAIKLAINFVLFRRRLSLLGDLHVARIFSYLITEIISSRISKTEINYEAVRFPVRGNVLKRHLKLIIIKEIQWDTVGHFS